MRLRTQNSISVFTTLSSTSAENTLLSAKVSAVQSLVFYHEINVRIYTTVMQRGLEVTSF